MRTYYAKHFKQGTSVSIPLHTLAPFRWCRTCHVGLHMDLLTCIAARHTCWGSYPLVCRRNQPPARVKDDMCASFGTLGMCWYASSH